MTDELTPLPYDHKKPPATDIVDKPVEVPTMVIHTANAVDKITTNKFWIGTKHFFYGFSIAATASIVAGAHPYLACGLGVAGGIAESARKVTKDTLAEKDSDWADILDKVLKIILQVLEKMKERKEVSK